MKQSFSLSLVLGSVLGALAFLTGCGGDAKKELNFYTWADYIDEELVKEFEAANNCIVRISYFDSNEVALAKLRTSNVPYDVILPTSYTVGIMRRENLIQPLNPEWIPNAKASIDPKVAAATGDPDLKFSVPYYQGFTGIGYNAEKLGVVPDSWTVYANPQFARRLALLDDMRETIGAALMTLGFDPNTTDDAQLQAAKELLLKWKANIAKFGVDDVKQDLRSGAMFAIHGYGGDILQITLEDPNIRFALPKEGVLLSYDHFVVSAKSKEPELAHQFIDFMCRPENALRNIEATQYIVPVPAAIEQIPEELKTLPGFVVTEEEIQAAKQIRDLGKDNEKYTKIWNEVRAN